MGHASCSADACEGYTPRTVKLSVADTRVVERVAIREETGAATNGKGGARSRPGGVACAPAANTPLHVELRERSSCSGARALCKAPFSVLRDTTSDMAKLATYLS